MTLNSKGLVLWSVCMLTETAPACLWHSACQIAVEGRPFSRIFERKCRLETGR